MTRFLSTTALGLLLAGGFLFTPATSHAQAPVGVRVQVGGLGFSYNQGYPYAARAPFIPVTPGCVTPAPVIVPTYGSAYSYPYYRNSYAYPTYPRVAHYPHHHRHGHR